MSKCENCGRGDGHYLGCEAIGRSLQDDRPPCEFGGCDDPRRPQGKGPAPKYCAFHADQKNRK